MVISDKCEDVQPRKMRVHPLVVDDALYYEYRSMLLRVDLQQHLRYLGSLQEKGIHSPAQVRVDCILDHQGAGVFLHFDTNYIRVLRRTPKAWNFHSVPLLSIELKCNSQLITSKLHKLFHLLRQEIDSRRNHARSTRLCPPPPAAFQPAQEEGAVERAARETGQWAEEVRREVERKEQEVGQEFYRVDEMRRKFNEKNRKKKELEDILIRMQTNNQEIDRLMNESALAHPATQKITQIVEMLTIASQKAAETSLTSTASDEFKQMARIQLANLDEVANSLRKCQENLENLH